MNSVYSSWVKGKYLLRSSVVIFTVRFQVRSQENSYHYLRPQTSVRPPPPQDVISCRFICEIFTKMWRLINILAKSGQDSIRFTSYNSTEHSPYWEANRSSASQELSHSLWNPKYQSPHSQQPATCPYPEPNQTGHAPHPTCRSISA